MPVPPEGFLDLASVAVDLPVGAVNVIGLVDSCDRLRQTKTGDNAWNLYLQDTQLKTARHLNYDKGLRVCFFARDIADLPAVNTQGDIILLRHVKPHVFQQRHYLQADKFATSVLIFPRATLPTLEFKEAYMGGKQRLISKGSATAKAQLSLQEIQYIIELNAKSDTLTTDDIPLKLSHSNDTTVSRPSSAQNSPAAAPNRRPGIIGTANGGGKRIALDSGQDFERSKIDRTTSRGRFKLMSEVNFESGHLVTFADLCVEVLRKFTDGYSVEILVSDYTENPMLPNRRPPEEEDSQGYNRSRQDFKGPYGQRVLKIVLETPHQEFVRGHVQQGDYVLIQNVKLKQDKYQHIQGDLWKDMRYPHKVLVQRLFDKTKPMVRDVVQRKTDYFNTRRMIEKPELEAAQTFGSNLTKQSEKLSAEMAEECTAEKAAQLAAERSAKNKAKKQRRKEKREKEEAEARAEEEQLNANNSHVRCSNPDKSLTSVHEILDPKDHRHINELQGLSYKLPFTNACFRAKVRVLDYHPFKLEDFAVEVSRSSDSGDEDDDLLDDRPQWEWNFTLVVQDATSPTSNLGERITVDIGHLQAQFLLGSDMPEPSDLRKDTVLLAKLRERLSILWGDLYEQKQQATADASPSNRPFECCISEYGVLKRGGMIENIDAWERRYMLHGVTIS